MAGNMLQVGGNDFIWSEKGTAAPASELGPFVKFSVKKSKFPKFVSRPGKCFDKKGSEKWRE